MGVSQTVECEGCRDLLEANRAIVKEQEDIRSNCKWILETWGKQDVCKCGAAIYRMRKPNGVELLVTWRLNKHLCDRTRLKPRKPTAKKRPTRIGSSNYTVKQWEKI